MNVTNHQAIAVILLSAFFVYSIRFLGLALGKRLPKTGVFKKAMDALPGTIFAALVFPGLLAAGCEVMTYRGDELSLKAEGGPTCLTRALVRD